MSKGAGHIERALVTQFKHRGALTVEELCGLIYPEVSAEARRRDPETTIGKKHRVAVVRAGKNAIRRGANIAVMGHGGRRNPLVFYVADSVAAYATALSYSNRMGWHDHQRWDEHMAPGGDWWLQVEHNKAMRNGDAERAAELAGQIEERRRTELKAREARLAAVMGRGR
jgi:hypothetical protein